MTKENMNPCNAIITSFRLGISDRYASSLELSLVLNLQGGGGCVFSVWGPFSEEYESNCFAYSVKRVLDICGVEDVSQLKGRPVRAKFEKDGGLGDTVIGIGNFLDDDWFIPKEEELYKNFNIK